jgi:hypothetical protein
MSVVVTYEDTLAHEPVECFIKVFFYWTASVV